MKKVIQTKKVLNYTDYLHNASFCPVDTKALTAAESSLLTKVLRARLVVTKTNVEVLRQDPNSPLYSVKSFDELNL